MVRPAAQNSVIRSLVKEICCHRLVNGKEQYLLLWQSDEPDGNRSTAIASWHDLGDLTSIVDLLQIYVEDFVKRIKKGVSSSLKVPAGLSPSLKRKSPHDEVASSRASSTDTSALPTKATHNLEVYNGILQRKSGDIKPIRLNSDKISTIDATLLPTKDMVAAAEYHLTGGVKQALKVIRREFLQKLSKIPGPPVTFDNDFNKETPSVSFTYIQDYVYGEGVSRTDADAVMLGCDKCRSSVRGCENTRVCGCLEYATPHFKGLSEEEEQVKMQQWENGASDFPELPKRFPYRLDNDQRTGIKQYVLDSFYLESRKVVYECNEKCKCGPNCKNRLVQKGRKVPLQIFKTNNKRGFGLRCPENLRRGQYIDKYLGELITDSEADARESASGPGRASYLFWLDKHAKDDEEVPGALRRSDCYVADGEKMGGPTRFINHSCDPNCRLFTVSYNKFDQKIYDLAFFALDDIPAGTELTFDYMDPEDGEAGQAEAVTDVTEEDGVAVDCLCGAKKCRGKLWM